MLKELFCSPHPALRDVLWPTQGHNSCSGSRHGVGQVAGRTFKLALAEPYGASHVEVDAPALLSPHWSCRQNGLLAIRF